MLRFFSLLLIAIASYLIGSVRVDRLSSELLHQERMLSLLSEIKRGILCYRLSLEEIVRAYRSLAEKQWDFLESAIAHSPQEAYRLHRESFGYDRFCDKQLDAFFSSIAGLSLADALQECERLQEMLSQEFEKRKAEFPNQRKLCLTLSVTLGLGLIILFI